MIKGYEVRVTLDGVTRRYRENDLAGALRLVGDLVTWFPDSTPTIVEVLRRREVSACS